MPHGIAWRVSSGNWSARSGRCWLLRRFCRLLATLRGLGPELLREPVDAALGIDQLLTAGEERVAVGADLQVQLVFGGSRLPGRPAGTARFDVVVLGVNAFLHGSLLTLPGKHRS